MTEPRPLNIPEEIDALEGQTVTVIATGMDAMAFRTQDGRTFMAAMCLGCGMHLGYYEIDESILQRPGDLATAG